MDGKELILRNWGGNSRLQVAEMKAVCAVTWITICIVISTVFTCFICCFILYYMYGK